jgi:hypothetical protein
VVSFEVDYGNRRIKALEFRVKKIFFKNNTIEVVGARSGRGLSRVGIIFERSFLRRRAKAFIRLLKQGRDRRIEAGISVVW